MTLKEQKIAIEQSVVERVKASLAENVEVNATYDLENAIVNISLKTENKDANGNSQNLVHYHVAYNEELKKVAISAFNRIISSDNYGPVAVVNSPIAIDEDFMMTMKMIVEAGIYAALNPIQPEKAEDPERNTEE